MFLAFSLGGFLWSIIKTLLLILLLVGIGASFFHLAKGSMKVGFLAGKKFDRKASEKLRKENQIRENQRQGELSQNNGLKW